MKAPSLSFLLPFILIIGTTLSLKAQVSVGYPISIQEIVESDGIMKYLDHDNYERLSPGGLWVLRNLYFGRKGYTFKNPHLNGLLCGWEGYDCDKSDVTHLLSASDKRRIKEIRELELKKRAQQREVVLKGDTFRLFKGVLTLYPSSEQPPTILGRSPDWKFLDISTISKGHCLVQISSDYVFQTIDCCGMEGLARNLVDQFYVHTPTGEIKKIPFDITLGREIVDLIDGRFLLVKENVFSGSFMMEVYDLKTMELRAKIDRAFWYSVKDGIIEIREITGHADYPNALGRDVYILQGNIFKRSEIMKFEAPDLYAG